MTCGIGHFVGGLEEDVACLFGVHVQNMLATRFESWLALMFCFVSFVHASQHADVDGNIRPDHASCNDQLCQFRTAPIEHIPPTGLASRVQGGWVLSLHD